MIFREKLLRIFLEGYSYQEIQNTDSTIEYEFKTDQLPYNVVFEYTGKYGWEMMFGIKQEDGSIDTKIITNQPKDVIKILNTIFGDILKQFVKDAISYEKEALEIILAPQLMDNEPQSLPPFERKRGKLYVRKIEEFIKTDMFWKSFDVSFKESSFSPKSIIMTVKRKENITQEIKENTSITSQDVIQSMKKADSIGRRGIRDEDHYDWVDGFTWEIIDIDPKIINAVNTQDLFVHDENKYEPVVLIKTYDHIPTIKAMDGNHRVLQAVEAGKTSIKAFFGTRKPRKQPLQEKLLRIFLEGSGTWRMAPNSAEYMGNCTSLDGDKIMEMQELSKEITRREFLTYVNKESLNDIARSLGYNKNFTMSKDWHVSYYKSAYEGIFCIYFVHSHIEYVFTSNQRMDESIKKYSKQQMIDLGADGSLSFGYLLDIPLEKLTGLEPTPRNNESPDGKYHPGVAIKVPIEVKYDKENDSYVVYGGNHRIAQAKANGQKTIKAFVEPDQGSIKLLEMPSLNNGNKLLGSKKEFGSIIEKRYEECLSGWDLIDEDDEYELYYDKDTDVFRLFVIDDEIKGYMAAQKYKNGYKVLTSRVFKQYQGQGIGYKMYQMLIKNVNCLISDNELTDGSAAIWNKLCKDYNVYENGIKKDKIDKNDLKDYHSLLLCCKEPLNESIEPQKPSNKIIKKTIRKNKGTAQESIWKQYEFTTSKGNNVKVQIKDRDNSAEVIFYVNDKLDEVNRERDSEVLNGVLYILGTIKDNYDEITFSAWSDKGDSKEIQDNPEVLKKEFLESLTKFKNAVEQYEPIEVPMTAERLAVIKKFNLTPTKRFDIDKPKVLEILETVGSDLNNTQLMDFVEQIENIGYGKKLSTFEGYEEFLRKGKKLGNFLKGIKTNRNRRQDVYGKLVKRYLPGWSMELFAGHFTLRKDR